VSTQIFEPSVRAYAKNTLAVGALGIPLIVVLFLQNRDKPLFAILAAIAIVGSVGGVLLYIARARVYVTPDSIGRRGFGPTKWMRRASVHRSLLVLKLTAGANAQSHLFLFAPDASLVMRLSGALWGEVQLRALTDALGLEQNVSAMPMSAAQLDEREPTALNWAERNPKALTGVVVAVFLVIAVIVAIAVIQLG
jgi:hypothetical protein